MTFQSFFVLQNKKYFFIFYCNHMFLKYSLLKLFSTNFNNIFFVVFILFNSKSNKLSYNEQLAFDLSMFRFVQKKKLLKNCKTKFVCCIVNMLLYLSFYVTFVIVCKFVLCCFCLFIDFFLQYCCCSSSNYCIVILF